MNRSTAVSGLDFCCYQRHSCSRPRYLNYKYCAQHIVEDNQSPFTSCEYLSRTTGRKCPNPALRPRKQNSLPIFCSEHLHELIVKEKHQKQKRKLRRKRKSEKASQEKSGSPKRQKLIEKLYKYCKGSSKSKESQSPDTSTDSEVEVEEVHRPIKDDWLLENSASFDTDADWDDFDAVNNEVYEPLRYADVLTPEEVVATAQSKLIRLQSLYMEQFKRLFHLLKERRRQYLEDRKKEMKEEKSASVIGRSVEYEENDEIYALATCGRRTGVEALLRKRQLQKRDQAEGKVHGNLPLKSTMMQRCTHTSNHTRCKLFCLPYTKYCSSHILEDPHQLMYRKCHTRDCPMPVRHLTARSYSVPTEDGSDEEEVNYCVVHAPLLEMTFDFPPIINSPEQMEVCEDLPEDSSTDLPTGVDANSAGLLSNSEHLPTVSIGCEASHHPSYEATKISNEENETTEVVAQRSSLAMPPPPDTAKCTTASSKEDPTCGTMPYSIVPEAMSVDDQSPGANVLPGDETSYTIQPDQAFQQVHITPQISCPTTSSTAETASFDSEVAKLTSDYVPEAVAPQALSRDRVNGKSATATLPSAVGTIPHISDLHHEENSTGDNVPCANDPQLISQKPGDAEHTIAAVVSAEAHAVPGSRPVNSQDNIIVKNVPHSVQPLSTSLGSCSTVLPIGDNLASNFLPIDSKGKLCNRNVPDSGDSQPTSGECKSCKCDDGVSTPATSGVDSAEKKDNIKVIELCKKDKSMNVGQARNISSLKTVTPDPHGIDQKTISKPEESVRRQSDESTQLREKNARSLSDTKQAPLDVLQIENSGDGDVASTYTDEESRSKEHFDVHEARRTDPSQDILASPQRSSVPRYISERGERKPSSAEEEMAVVSLLQLCSGHASDEPTSSSTEQE